MPRPYALQLSQMLEATALITLRGDVTEQMRVLLRAYVLVLSSGAPSPPKRISLQQSGAGAGAPGGTAALPAGQAVSLGPALSAAGSWSESAPGAPAAAIAAPATAQVANASAPTATANAVAPAFSSPSNPSNSAAPEQSNT